jgi:hypothetical protein
MAVALLRLRAYPSSSYIFGKPWKINALPVSLRPTGIGSKIYELINAGRLETVKIGRRTLVRTDSIRAIAREGRTDAA